MNLTDTLQHWLQGQINASIDGVLARLDGLERYRDTVQAGINNLLHTEVRTLAKLVSDLEAQNNALREELAYVKNNVKELV